MKVEIFKHIVNELSPEYGGEIQWQQNLKPCDNSENFFSETCWVILNSGMKEQIARLIWNRIKDSWENNGTASDVFRHKGKVAALEYIRTNKQLLFNQYLSADDKVSFLQTLPFIGAITKYHLAKNLGFDCVKPDRHLVRIANQYNTTPDELCERLSKESGYKKCTVDIILWRAANLKMI